VVGITTGVVIIYVSCSFFRARTMVMIGGSDVGLRVSQAFFPPHDKQSTRSVLGLNSCLMMSVREVYSF
jgi:hypothetical protein